MPRMSTNANHMNGWQQVAEFLGQPSSVAQRRAKSGMPVTHEGRGVHASSDDLNLLLRQEPEEDEEEEDDRKQEDDEDDDETDDGYSE